MSKRAWIILAVVVVVLVAAAVGHKVLRYKTVSQPSETSVVLMTNGDIYVGNLSYHPRLTLTEAYQVTRESQPDPKAEANFRLVPFKEALWSPDRLYINPKQVMLTAPVGENSRIMEALKTAAK